MKLLPQQISVIRSSSSAVWQVNYRLVKKRWRTGIQTPEELKVKGPCLKYIIPEHFGTGLLRPPGGAVPPLWWIQRSSIRTDEASQITMATTWCHPYPAALVFWPPKSFEATLASYTGLIYIYIQILYTYIYRYYVHLSTSLIYIYMQVYVSKHLSRCFDHQPNSQRQSIQICCSHYCIIWMLRTLFGSFDDRLNMTVFFFFFFAKFGEIYWPPSDLCLQTSPDQSTSIWISLRRLHNQELCQFSAWWHGHAKR